MLWGMDQVRKPWNRLAEKHLVAEEKGAYHATDQDTGEEKLKH